MAIDILPCYLIATLYVKDYDEYMTRYGIPSISLLNDIGADVQIASAQAEILEGDWRCNWTVVIKFQSKASAHEFYSSPAYTRLRELRINELTDGGSVVLVDGLDISALA